MSPNQRRTAGLTALTVAAVVLAACGADDVDVAGPTPSPTVATTPDAAAPVASPTAAEEGREDGALVFTVSGGEVTTGEERVTVPVGSEVTVRVTADADDEIHVHGYDLHQDVVAGEEATLTFTADIPGVFEIELEDSGLLLTKLEVR